MDLKKKEYYYMDEGSLFFNPQNLQKVKNYYHLYHFQKMMIL
jgi:hypothetical protein